MTRLFCFCLLLFAAGLTPVQAAGSGLSAALPAGAHVAAYSRIESSRPAYAVLFTSPGPHVGVVSGTSGSDRLVWSRSLPIPAQSIRTIGSGGLFQGTGHDGGPGRWEFFALRFNGKTVTSAIAGRRGGVIMADEGIRVGAGVVVARRRDRGHVGSVKYSILTRYELKSGTYRKARAHIRPDYPSGQLPAPNATVRTEAGSTFLLRLEVASTPAERDTGLMNRTQLDADSGMIFVWPSPVLESFWMENTYIPLTVAFLAPDGAIQEMQDMSPLTLDYHTPQQPYQYAIEANLGYFAARGIRVGDRMVLHLPGAAGS